MTISVLQLENEPVEYNYRRSPEIMMFGNKISLLYALFSIFITTKIPKRSIDIPIPLQKDLSNLLSYMITSDYDFKYVKSLVTNNSINISQFLNSNEFDRFYSQNNLNSVSKLDLKLN